MTVAPGTRVRHPAQLDVEDLSVRFGGVHALNGVTFTAEAGSIVGLIGANGSGKTTTLDVISGLVKPQSGRVRLDGTDLGGVPPRRAPRRRHGPLVPGLPPLPRALGARRAAVERGRAPRGGGPVDDAAAPVGAPGRASQARGGRSGHRRVRPRAVPPPPHGRAVDGDPAGRRPGVHRPGAASPAAPRRAHGRHRAAGGGGLHPAPAAHPRGGRHHHRARRARRPPRVRAVLDRDRDGAGPGRGGRTARTGPR